MIIPCKLIKVIKWLVKVMSGFMIIINDDDRAVLLTNTSVTYSY